MTQHGMRRGKQYGSRLGLAHNTDIMIESTYGRKGSEEGVVLAHF